MRKLGHTLLSRRENSASIQRAQGLTGLSQEGLVSTVWVSRCHGLCHGSLSTACGGSTLPDYLYQDPQIQVGA